jgi:hypothetical protein
MADPNRHTVYLTDSTFWSAKTGRAYSQLLPRAEWAAFANQVYDDALRNPVPLQDRCRRTFAGPLKIGIASGSKRALAYMVEHRIDVAADYLYKWVALHEIAHMLVKPTRQHHGPEFIGVYSSLIERWGDKYTAAAWNRMYRVIGSLPQAA